MCSFSLWCVLGSILLIVGSHVAQAHDSSADYVNAHNAARSAITSANISNIVWDNKVAAFAQNYANQCKDCKPIPSGSGGRYGENIAVSTGYKSGTDAVKMWVEEEPHYDHYNNSCVGGECLHYTQVVWESSLRLGCGKVRCDNGGTFVTCNYYPPGNIAGQLPY